VIPPKRDAGPVLLTPYSPAGSLADVLERVARGEDVPFWTDACKLRLIVTAVAGLRFLHSRGIVHRDLRPSHLILEQDGSVRITGYVTALLAERRAIKETMMRAPLYLAPEVYEVNKGDDRPPVDVFAFALILYQLVTGKQWLTATMTPAAIMRAVFAEARPAIDDPMHAVLLAVISEGWQLHPDDRPSFDDIWERLRAVGFQVFPDVDVQFTQAEKPA
jgi:serine/threonine protein kinase